MDITQLLGVAASVSLLAGWRLYLCVLATGLAMHFGLVPHPEHLAVLKALDNPWVMGIAGLGTLAEFFADKIPWLDSLWDMIHTAIRPLGGAALALAIVDPSQPAWQAVVFLAGGGGALLAHGGKAGARAAINLSPEPVTNVVASTAEDIATTSLLAAAYHYPGMAAAIAGGLLLVALGLLYIAHRLYRIAFPAKPRRKAVAASTTAPPG